MPAMTSFKLTLAYDGTGFVGWQRQANGVSIQALHRGRAARARRPRRSRCGRRAHRRRRPRARPGRGVHARARASTPDALVARAERAAAAGRPRPRRGRGAAGVPRALRRARQDLRYRLWNARRAEPVRARLRLARARTRSTSTRCARRRGCSKAATISPRSRRRQRSRRRATIAVAVDAIASRSRDPRGSRDGRRHCCVYEVTGDGFLRHMVRTIVGTLVEIGRGRQPAEWIASCWRRAIARRPGRPRRRTGCFWSRVDYATCLRQGPKSLYTRGLLTKEPNVA